MENVNIKINGMDVSAPKGSTILEAARLAHIEIPTLCFLKDINEIGACFGILSSTFRTASLPESKSFSIKNQPRIKRRG